LRGKEGYHGPVIAAMGVAIKYLHGNKQQSRITKIRAIMEWRLSDLFADLQ
jgi:hypothetical protein